LLRSGISQIPIAVAHLAYIMLFVLRKVVD
jgi:hypothetical protein